MMAFDDLVFRISAQGTDSRGLGRWSYITITGKDSLSTTILTCCCPCCGTFPGSAYSQQLVYMAENKDNIPANITCRWQLFSLDLKKRIEELTTEGHPLIVKGDFKFEYEDLKPWMIYLGYIDVIGSKHGKGPRIHMYSNDGCSQL